MSGVGLLRSVGESLRVGDLANAIAHLLAANAAFAADRHQAAPLAEASALRQATARAAPRRGTQGRTRAGSRTLPVRWTLAELDLVRERAARCGLSVSDYSRALLLGSGGV